MVLEVRLSRVGDAVALIIPEEALAHLKLREGDTLLLTEIPEGGLRLTPSTSEVGRQLETAERLIGRYRNTLRDLAE